MNRAFGERILWLPFSVDDYSGTAPDASREEREGVGVVPSSPVVKPIDGATQPVMRAALRRCRIWLSPDQYAALGGDLRPGDRIVLLERDGAPAYRISGPLVPTDRGDQVADLVLEI